MPYAADTWGWPDAQLRFHSGSVLNRDLYQISLGHASVSLLFAWKKLASIGAPTVSFMYSPYFLPTTVGSLSFKVSLEDLAYVFAMICAATSIAKWEPHLSLPTVQLLHGEVFFPPTIVEDCDQVYWRLSANVAFLPSAIAWPITFWGFSDVPAAAVIAPSAKHDVS